METMKVATTRTYFDTALDREVKKGEVLEVTTARGTALLEKGVAVHTGAETGSAGSEGGTAGSAGTKTGSAGTGAKK